MKRRSDGLPARTLMTALAVAPLDVRLQRLGQCVRPWFEKFAVTNFATVDLPRAPGTPRIDYLGEINTDYGNRPYKGSSAFLRLLYRS